MARIEQKADPEPRTDWGETLPGFVREVSWLRWLLPLSAEQRLTIGFIVLAALLYVPWLGATGFWDPWEPHYGEVAREMIARGDYIHPWWESTWFFSKPALDLWLMAAGMLAVNANGPDRFVGVFTEWGVRLPYAVITAAGAVLLFVMADRLLTRRSAMIGTLAILTSPLFVFLARQAVPDPIFVGLLEGAMACLMIVLLDDSDEAHHGWAAAFYCFVGLATLSKGLLGFALPGAVTLVYCVVTGEWHRLRRLHLAAGSLIVLVICLPWYGTMFAFDGRDDEGKTFFERFIVHDHFKRLALGVHTTTPGGTFTYFVEQIGFDCFPWVFAFPGAATVLTRIRVRPQSSRERAMLFLLLWFLIGFAVFAFSATKFHHYAFPVLAPLLFFSALWVEQLLDEGLWGNAGPVFTGALLYALVAHDLALTPKHLTDMFVYNYDRPYPDKETNPRQVFTVLFYAGAAVALSPWIFDRLAQLLRWVRRKPAVALSAGEPPQDRNVTVWALVAVALSFAVFCGWFHWRRLSPHWTQRDLFWEYYHQSTPDEPIAAYQMNWRGETFYSRNTVRQVGRPGAPAATLADFMNGPGQRKWFLVEHSRLNGLRQALGNARLRVVESRNNKFALAVAERPEEKSTIESQPEKPPGPIGAPP
jgi:4-amino-4-deoxy-L-arabinose transferase-like glycosyltransferase